MQSHSSTMLSYIIECDSVGKRQLVQQLADKETALDAVIVRTRRASPDSIQHVQTQSYRLGDYFEEIKTEVAPESPTSFRLMFQPKDDVGSSWKDLVIQILNSVSRTYSGVTVAGIVRS